LFCGIFFCYFCFGGFFGTKQAVYHWATFPSQCVALVSGRIWYKNKRFFIEFKCKFSRQNPETRKLYWSGTKTPSLLPLSLHVSLYTAESFFLLLHALSRWWSLCHLISHHPNSRKQLSLVIISRWDYICSWVLSNNVGSSSDFRRKSSLWTRQILKKLTNKPINNIPLDSYNLSEYI
jgi:hypothetical protein